MDSTQRMDDRSIDMHHCIIGIFLCLLSLALVNPSVAAMSLNKESNHQNDFFDYVGALPRVQNRFSVLNISSIVHRYYPSFNATLLLSYPDGEKQSFKMNWSDKGKFIYKSIFEDIGKYSFFVSISNSTKIVANSSFHHFWIVYSQTDMDGDGMPDEWERQFDFNPYSAFDARIDADDDGFSNREEYELGLNPLEKQPIENNIHRLRQNIDFVLISFFFFLVISFCSFYGMKRSLLWM